LLLLLLLLHFFYIAPRFPPLQVKQVGSESLQVPVLAASGKQKGFLQITLTYHTQVRPYNSAAAAVCVVE
jgi:hypothetical protein